MKNTLLLCLLLSSSAFAITCPVEGTKTPAQALIAGHLQTVRREVGHSDLSYPLTLRMSQKLTAQLASILGSISVELWDGSTSSDGNFVRKFVPPNQVSEPAGLVDVGVMINPNNLSDISKALDQSGFASSISSISFNGKTYFVGDLPSPFEIFTPTSKREMISFLEHEDRFFPGNFTLIATNARLESREQTTPLLQRTLAQMPSKPLVSEVYTLADRMQRIEITFTSAAQYRIFSSLLGKLGGTYTHNLFSVSFNSLATAKPFILNQSTLGGPDVLHN